MPDYKKIIIGNLQIEIMRTGQIVKTVLPEKNFAKKKKCQTCKTEDGLPKHACPFEEDVNANYDKNCNCCEDCQNICTKEI